MDRNLTKEYLSWISKKVNGDQYTMLFKELYSTEFKYVFNLDCNRAGDGIELRYKFANECDVPQPLVALYLDVQACSVLEMMVALAIRIEDTLMGNPYFGDRTAFWFEQMLMNTRLDIMTDDNYDERYVRNILYILLTRSYDKNGMGGLFYLKNPPEDMRKVDIFHQVCWYLDENFGEE